MNKGLLAGVIILALALISAAVYGMQLSKENNNLSLELQAVKTELAGTKAELASTVQSLANTQNDLSAVKATLSDTQSELSDTKDALASTSAALNTINATLIEKLSELNTANIQYTSALTSLTAVQNTLAATQKKLTSAQDTLTGLGITVASSAECTDVKLTDSPAAKNPTWQQLKDFITKDKTEDHQYIENVYDCSQFSQALHDKAEAVGIKAAEVNVSFLNERAGHALVAFITSDYGLVYIDCTQSPDTVSNVIAGKEFRAVEVGWMVAPANLRNQSWWDSLSSYFFMRGSSGGHSVTSKIYIYW
jgi:hypothetical protein